MKKAVSVLLGIVLAAALICLTAVIAGPLAVYGAGAAGMEVSSTWAFGSLPLEYLIFGGLAGAVLFLPVAAGCYFLVGKKRGDHPNWSMLVSWMVICLLAFPGGFAFYQGGLVLQEREQEKARLSIEREMEAQRVQKENDRKAEAEARPWIVIGE